MEIPLNRDSAVPMYQQIQEHVARLIRESALAPHTRLPATRRLAADPGACAACISCNRCWPETAGEGTGCHRADRRDRTGPATPPRDSA